MSMKEQFLKKIDEFNPEIIVLAKYMRILSSQFVEKYEGKVLNIHHSFFTCIYWSKSI